MIVIIVFIINLHISFIPNRHMNLDGNESNGILTHSIISLVPFD